MPGADVLLRCLSRARHTNGQLLSGIGNPTTITPRRRSASEHYLPQVLQSGIRYLSSDTQSPTPTPTTGEEQHRPQATNRLLESKKRTTARISTLDPSRVTAYDAVTIYKPACQNDIRIIDSQRRSESCMALFPRSIYPPSGTLGFFYCHSRETTPPLAQELRFRMTRSTHPNDFASGSDLMYKHLPWSIPLFLTLVRPNYRVLKGIAVRDGFLSEDAVASIDATTEMSFKMTPVHDLKFLHSFGEPFYVDLASMGRSFTFIGRDGVVNRRLDGLFSFRDSSESGPDIISNFYEGKLLCAFEQSTLPEHAGKRVVVIRVLRVLEPVRPVSFAPSKDGTPSGAKDLVIPPEMEPREGELARSLTHMEGLKVWSVDMEMPGPKNFAQGLEILYDNLRHYGDPRSTSA